MLVDLDIAPGIYTEQTGRGAVNRWKNGDMVRFRKGLPEKIGGWVQKPGDILGVARAVHDWESLDGELWVAIGTHRKLYLWQNDTLFDITPLRDSGQLTNPFDTTDGSNVVVVTHTAHGAQEGDAVRFDNASAVGGITIDGEYVIGEILTANTYEIVHSAAATSTANGGGTVDYEYDISIGQTAEAGYGAGPYGEEEYGTPRSITVPDRIRIWSLDNWGEDLVASPRDGNIYTWDRSAGTGTRATHITQAPDVNVRILVSPQDRHLVSLGADDPLVVEWCDQEDFTNWTATLTNTAGDKRLDNGSQLITAVRTRGEIVLFTDLAVYSMQHIGPPLTFGFSERGDASIIGPNAAVDVNGVVYFMSLSNFMVYDGSLRIIFCDVRNLVYDNLNLQNNIARDSVFAAHNSLFSEVTWFYPDRDAEEANRFVSFNYEDGVWSVGQLSRTAYHDQSAVFRLPYAISPDGKLYVHEVGSDDVTLDGETEVVSAIRASVESYDAEIPPGGQYMHIDRIIPDLKELTGGTLNITLRGKAYPNTSPALEKGPFVVTSTTEKIDMQMRERQVSVKLESTDKGVHWRHGTLRFNVRPHGRR